MAAKKKTTTSRVKDAFGAKPRPTEAEARRTAEEITSAKKETRGRPKATHGLRRTSVMADPEQMRRLKIAAAESGRHMYELLSEALEDYLAKHGG